MEFGEVLVHVMTVLQLHCRNNVMRHHVIVQSMPTCYICCLFSFENKQQDKNF
jgi:hypothetical protein